ncbi:HK97 gp10 family phage protein [Psychrobacillus sp. FSL K6-2684]|uniref:HK97 gp10 family phage protein n=1 Tax=Psychrobacillus sp. FSL K6-2684 TaxID=2921547 RepID=UPI0030FB1CDB
MEFELEGLTDFQNDLLEVAQRKLPKESFKIMRKVGSKARTVVAREARSKVKKKSGNYHKKFKRGKVFRDRDGDIIVRVINSSHHAHLIEDGHRMVTKSGDEVGFVPGKKVVEHGINNFNSSGQFEELISDWLDDLLDSSRL